MSEDDLVAILGRSELAGCDLRSRRVPAGEVELHLVEAGPGDGPPVLLLHGFPEFWYGWRRQIGPLAAAGYRLLVPDQRGYNLSAKPRGVAAYGLDRLVGDVVGLLDALGLARVDLIAHDWGAAVAWWTAVCHPGRLGRLAILNVPHPAVLRRALLTDRAQRRRSSYIFYFQLPWLPERKLGRDSARLLRRMFERTSRPGTFSPAELERYAEAALRPGALTGMLNWYRAALRHPPRPVASRRVSVPTQILWGTEDVALGAAMIEPSAALCDEVEVTRFTTAGHWLQHEEPAEVNRRLLEFLASPS